MQNSENSGPTQSKQLDRRRTLPEPIFITDRKHTDDFVIDDIKFASGKFANVYHVKPKKAKLNDTEDKENRNASSRFQNNNNTGNASNAQKASSSSSSPNQGLVCSSPLTRNNNNNNTLESTRFCAKIVRRRKAGKDLTSDIKHECSILQLAKEENSKFIIKLVQSYEQSREFQLILEYAPGEELWYHLIDQKHYTPETHPLKHYKRLMFEVALGLQWLHNHRIVHLDLKPSNIFLTSKVFTKSKALIADFGLSRKLPEKAEVKKRKSLIDIIPNNTTNTLNKSKGTVQEYKPSTNVDINEFGEVRVFAGTADFCAPEVLRYDYIDLSADLFSLGCCYYIMLTGYSAFQAEDEYTERNLENQKTFLNIEQLEESYDHEVFEKHAFSVDLIKSLLKKKAANRLSIDNVVSHAYFDGFRD